MKDALMYEPLLTPGEIESYLTDLRALQEGKIRGFVGTDFWQRVTAEMVRRQANAQIGAANSLKRATWTLAILTGLLVVFTLLPLAFQNPKPEKLAEVESAKKELQNADMGARSIALCARCLKSLARPLRHRAKKSDNTPWPFTIMISARKKKFYRIASTTSSTRLVPQGRRSYVMACIAATHAAMKS
jgi:hypothetical protein